MPQHVGAHQRNGRPVRDYFRRSDARSPWEALGPMSRSMDRMVGNDQMYFDEDHYAVVERSYKRGQPWKWALIEIVKLTTDGNEVPSDYTLREGFAMTREGAKQMAERAAQEHGLLPLELI